jgi:hypothetical protein
MLAQAFFMRQIWTLNFFDYSHSYLPNCTTVFSMYMLGASEYQLMWVFFGAVVSLLKGYTMP